MFSFQFHNPGKCFFGKDAIKELPGLVKGKKVILVYGCNSAKKNNALASTIAVLNESKIPFVEFGGNSFPDIKKIEEGAAICRKEGVDCVIGIGGCVCMDMAKVIAFGAKNDNIWSYCDGGNSASTKERLLVGAIPTYPAGGSEADDAAEVENTELGESGTFCGVFNDFSILNPEFTYTLDKVGTTYVAMVAFTQASVCYLGGDCKMTNSFNKTIIDTVMSSLEILLKDPQNYDARSNQMWASALITSGLLYCGKPDLWSMSIYTEMNLVLSLMKLTYRQALTVLFPRWLKAKAAHHQADAARYFIDILNVDSSLPPQEIIEQGLKKLSELYTSNGLEMSFSAFAELPSDEKIRECIKKTESPDLSEEELFQMVKECLH